MSREAHVRFWEGVGVRFPRATRLPARPRQSERGALLPGLPSRFLQPTPTSSAKLGEELLRGPSYPRSGVTSRRRGFDDRDWRLRWDNAPQHKT